MFEKIKYKSIVLSSIIFVLCFAYKASATDINASADIISNVSVTEQTPLYFGQFSSGTLAGGVDFDAGSGITSSGGVTLLGGEISGLARLDTTGKVAGTTVTVTTIATSLDDGGNSMVLVANCFGPGGPVGGDNTFCTFTSTSSSTEDVIIGGKLTVGANQPPGTYTGVISVIAAF